MDRYDRNYEAIQRLLRLKARVPKKFSKRILSWILALQNGYACYRKPSAPNFQRILLTAAILYLLVPDLKVNFSNLYEITCKALDLCDVEKYSTRKSILAAAINLAVFLVYIKVLPQKTLDNLRQIKIYRHKERVINTLTYKQFHMILRTISRAYCKKPDLGKTYCAIVSFLFHTGVRVGGLIHLKLEDCDFKNHKILFRDQKGGKNIWVAINKSLEVPLSQYLEIRPESDYLNLFINPCTGKPFTLDRLQKIVQKIHKKANIPFAGCHSYRRGFASHYASRGIPVTHIQKVLGHSDIKTTSLYINHDLDEILDQMRDW